MPHTEYTPATCATPEILTGRDIPTLPESLFNYCECDVSSNVICCKVLVIYEVWMHHFSNISNGYTHFTGCAVCTCMLGFVVFLDTDIIATLSSKNEGRIQFEYL